MDSNVLLRKWILSKPSITALLGTNVGGSVYIGDLVKGYNPDLGLAVQIINVGGQTEPETFISNDRKQVRVWGGVEKGLDCKQLYLEIRKQIHGATNVAVPGAGYVMSCLEAVSGQDITDPDTGWATVLGFFQLMAREL